MNVPAFDKLWREIVTNEALMVKHFNGARNAFRLFRRTAYRFAKGVLIAQEHLHNELIEMVHSTGMDLDTWMDQKFYVIEQAGDDRRRLFSAIKEGMTEREYIEQGPVWLVRRHTKKSAGQAKHVEADISAPVPTEPMSDTEQIALLTAQLDAAKSEIRELRKLRKDLAIALAEIDRLRTLVSRMEKMILASKQKAS